MLGRLVYSTLLYVLFCLELRFEIGSVLRLDNVGGISSLEDCIHVANFGKICEH